jgi:holin-like protein
MIRAVALLLLFQLGGEVVARALGLPVPGPVIGLAAMFAALVLRPTLRPKVEATAATILRHLSLLFVPAGVGVIAHLETFGRQGPALLAALTVSTAAAILAAVYAFRVVARLTGAYDE